MNSISFNIESLGGNHDYIYIIREGEAEINEFAHKMIINNNIKCFVPYVYEIKRGQHQLRYSSGKQISVSDFSQNRFSDIGACASLVISILNAFKTAEDYMIARKYILLDADFMFLNTKRDTVSVTCLPLNNAQDGSLSSFFRDVIMPVNFGSTINGDTFKVAVYQFPFDTESIDNALLFFNKFINGQTQKSALFAAVQGNAETSHKGTVTQQTIPQFSYATPSGGNAPDTGTRYTKPAEQVPTQSSLGIPFAVPPGKDSATKKKERKPSMFGSLFDTSQKTASPTPKKSESTSPFGVVVPGANNNEPTSSNPFGIEVPGQKSAEKPTPSAKEKKASFLFSKKKNESIIVSPTNNQPATPAYIPKPDLRPASSPDIADNNEGATVFDDGATVFGDEAYTTARLVDKHGKSYSILYSTFTVGRNGKSNSPIKVDLDIPVNTISHNHATIYNENGYYYIVDNGSRNGTFVDGRRLVPNEKTELFNNSVIRFHNTEYTFMI